MRVAGTPYEVPPLAAHKKPAGSPAAAAPALASGVDVATVSPAAIARAAATVDTDKIAQLKQELAAEALSPNPTNIAAMMLAEPSGDGR